MLENYFDDNGPEQESSRLTNMMLSLMGFSVRMILAITTGGFFYEYVGDLFQWLVGPQYSPMVSAVTGMFMIDFTAFVFSRLKQNVGSTEDQLDVVNVGFWFNLSLTVVVTFVFVILSTDFVSVREPSGAFNGLGEAVNIIGFFVATLAFVINGVFWAYYADNSRKALEAENQAIIMAAMMAGKQTIKQREVRAVVQSTNRKLTEAIPDWAEEAAEHSRDRFVHERRNRIGGGRDVLPSRAVGGGDLFDDTMDQTNIDDWLRSHDDEARIMEPDIIPMSESENERPTQLRTMGSARPE